jgi:phosphatidylserine/phosphatidylglycerophosphate/cardiolipin synthase-like enzyme
MDRLTITEAANLLGVSEADVEDRLKRNLYEAEEDPNGNTYVYIPSAGRHRLIAEETRQEDIEQRAQIIKLWSSDQSEDPNYLQSKVIETIRSAKSCIYVQVYKFRSDNIKDELIDACKQGRTVKVLLDKHETKGKGPQKHIANGLQREGIGVRLDSDCQKAHVKVLIIDKKVVLTGSFNLNRREKVDSKRPQLDNLVEIHDVQVARQFLDVFDNHWEKGRPHKANKSS